MRVLIHTCCGPCASSIVERMLERGHTVTMFFYNPNIFPRDEYMKRERSARKVAEYFGIEFIDPIDPSADGWEKALVSQGERSGIATRGRVTVRGMFR